MQSGFERHWARFPILGLAYLASSLRQAGHQVDLLDGKLDELNVEQICSEARRLQPDLIGITCMTVEFPTVATLATRLKQTLPGVPIAVGGAHVNAVGTDCLRECGSLDFVCVGEGEDLIVELAATLEAGGELGNILGLGFRNGDGVTLNPVRPYLNDLDRLPFPAWDMFSVRDQIPVLTHRGCPFRCNFCSHNSGFRPRYRTPENVLRELAEIVDRHQPKVIRFEDETFGLNMKRTKRILQGILDSDLHQRVSFSAQTRVDKIDADFVALLKTANFQTLELGVESGNPEILRNTRKGITLEQVEYAVSLARQAGLLVWCKFILGHPNETSATLKDTANFIARINPDRLSVAIMTPFPGTPIHDMAVRGEGGYRLLAEDWAAFDKYSTGVLELESASLGRLKAYQIWCYAKLYLWNGRLLDLAQMLRAHFGMAMELLWTTASTLVRERLGRGKLGPMSQES